MKAVLASCNRVLRTSKHKSLKQRRCVLFDVDGIRTGRAPPVGIPFGETAPGPDRPLISGWKWDATNPSKRGVMVMLHGCNNAPLVGWEYSWINYYRASGFRVVVPNSFAEARDPETCGLDEERIDQQTRNIKLRIAQTRRTLINLRKQYPGEPIYIHGHSEGGFVAQALGEKVSGIIVTGAPCGFGFAGAYLTAPNVPILIIVGVKDPYVPGISNAKQLASVCAKVRGAGKLKPVLTPGVGHFAALWWPNVAEEVAAFLKIAPIRVSQRAARQNENFASPNYYAGKRYDKAPLHKAIAARQEDWAVEWGADSRKDAEEWALFKCDYRVGGDPYGSKSHACVVTNVDGKPVVKQNPAASGNE
jgi:pimeloyl-ACP methyl ester carboxylesterase